LRPFALTIFIALLGSLFSARSASAIDPYAEASNGRFKIFAVLAKEPGWQEEWSKPTSHTPHFDTPGTIKSGEKVRLLILVANPAAASGSIKLLCDADFASRGRPTEQDIPEHVCAEGKVPSADMYFMATYSIVLSADTSRKSELITGVVRVADANSGKTLSVKLGVRVEP